MIDECSQYHKYSLKEINEPEVASVSQLGAKVLRRKHSESGCPLCGCDDCNIVIVDSEGNRVA